MIYVIRQPDGTLAQIPTWMCFPDAAAMTVTDRPRVALAALRDLRSLLDTLITIVLPHGSWRATWEDRATFWNRWSRVRH